MWFWVVLGTLVVLLAVLQLGWRRLARGANADVATGASLLALFVALSVLSGLLAMVVWA